jgi:hypothetical protein
LSGVTVSADRRASRSLRHPSNPRPRTGVLDSTLHADPFDLEEIIDPRDTQPLLCRWVEDAYDAQAGPLGPKSRGMRP